MKRMVSGIKPTGRVTLGNYIGAIRNFKTYQEEFEMMIFIANLHAITTPQDKAELKKNTKDLAALYLACGLNPEKTTLFLQTDVLEHANLGFVMNCITYMGELNRMTQYKDKVQKQEETSLSVGLFTYPDLMAADILLYDPDYVPVGEDQKQHVELTRDLAERFNHRFGDTFKVPEPYIESIGARIMSLSDPTKKMSKSDDSGDRGCIYLLDDPAIARKKIMSAVTDSESSVHYDVENKKGISNLMVIYSSLTGLKFEEIEAKYQGCNYGTFKHDLGEIVFSLLQEIQVKYHQIISSGEIERVLEEGAKNARLLASRKLEKVYRKIGLSIR